jgi:two-component system sensor histidine kinase and response regulator WspE
MTEKKEIPPALLKLFKNDAKRSLSMAIEAVESLQIQGDSKKAKEYKKALKNFRVTAKLCKLADLIAAVEILETSALLVDNENRALTSEELQAFTALVTDVETLIQTKIQKVPDKSSAEPKSEPKVGQKIDSSSANPVDTSLLYLFKSELEVQLAIMNERILEIEAQGSNEEAFDALMRAAHSLKGASRVVGLQPMVDLAHKLEDCFVALQKKNIIIQAAYVDIFLNCFDLFSSLTQVQSDVLPEKIESLKPQIEQLVEILKGILLGKMPKASIELPKAQKTEEKTLSKAFVRVAAENLNQLLGIAGESLVESKGLHNFTESLLGLKKMQRELVDDLNALSESMRGQHLETGVRFHLGESFKNIAKCRRQLSQNLSDFEIFIRRQSKLSDRLYQEVVSTRMRPFSEGIQGLPRLVRDLARQLGKKVKLEIVGDQTPVDRDVLEKLKAPLNHLIRNALDHGIDSLEDREAQNKSSEGIIRLEARHHAGMLSIIVQDDGKGIDQGNLKKVVVKKGLATEELVATLSDSELFDFLLLPGFSTTETVTTVSGRGVGLDSVQSMIQELSGYIRISSEVGKGTSFNLQLPLTLSVIRALIVEIAGEAYAFPLPRIKQVLSVHIEDVSVIRDKQFVSFEGENIGLISGYQLLEKEQHINHKDLLPVIVISDRFQTYGIVLDRFIEEKELVIQELDPLLGTIKNIASAAIMENGDPVLVIDIEDMARNIDKMIGAESLVRIGVPKLSSRKKTSKQILVIDDSAVVREVECRILRNHGYIVDTAVDGIDGWNTARSANYDLIITDVDMPRMTGLELVRRIKLDEHFSNVPVMIVSYKDREEDKVKGLEAGANYYLTKSSFHDDTLIDVVQALIGNSNSN